MKYVEGKTLFVFLMFVSSQMTLSESCMACTVLLVQRCILIGLYHFILKQVNNSKCMAALRSKLGYILV